MRVVLDTNVLISACLKPAGLEAHVVQMALNGEIEICVTEEVLAEYHEVLRRPKFRAAAERAETLLALISQRAQIVKTEETVTAALDDDDNRFLECAAAGRADYLITGNLRHYPPAWERTRVVNARQFTERDQTPRNPGA